MTKKENQILLSMIVAVDNNYLMGSDSLRQFKKWMDPKMIIDESRVIVAIRPGFRPSDIPNWILAKIQFASIPRIEISSTTIRERWVNDKTIRY